MKALATVVKGSIKYEAFLDEERLREYFIGQCDIDFDNEAQKREYLQRFKNEELFVYGVKQSVKCECCNQFKELDSLWGIDAGSPEEAISDYNFKL